jgi:hypothetical protein
MRVPRRVGPLLLAVGGRRTSTDGCWRGATVLLVLASIWPLAGCATESPRPYPTESVRPRIGQVVDADTGKPIDGAVILDVFYLWPRRGFGDFPVSKVFSDSAQAVTDSEGRFTLSGPFDSLSWWTEGLYIFEPGYGPWRLRSQNEVAILTEAEEWSWRRQTWDRFTASGVVIELRPLRTREERLKYIDRGWASSDVLGAADRRRSGSTSLTLPSIAWRTSNAQSMRSERASA